jgi:hypothetical protein
MIKSNNSCTDDTEFEIADVLNSRSLYLRTIEGILQNEDQHEEEEVFADYEEYKSLTISHEVVISYSYSRLVSETYMSYTIADLRKIVMKSLVKQFPNLKSRFERDFEYSFFEYPIKTPFDIININEIKLDGQAVLHSFIVLDHIHDAMYPTLQKELYRILENACKKISKDELIVGCSVATVLNPAETLKRCFKAYTDKVYRVCGF